ncbi:MULTISPECIES: hypothetical protein [unclassified Micromonospora]|uniref:hypothetical protein n=1 Tax=unclassified Micromonospora TaxID=2617518 RepID=UPI00332A5B8E
MSSRLRAIARDTVAIAERGTYRTADGEVDIGSQVARAVAGTRLHLPGEAVAAPSPVDAAPGAFGNDPVTVATALHHSPWFDEVVFAILDRQPATPTHAAFAGALRPTP